MQRLIWTIRFCQIITAMVGMGLYWQGLQDTTSTVSVTYFIRTLHPSFPAMLSIAFILSTIGFLSSPMMTGRITTPRWVWIGCLTPYAVYMLLSIAWYMDFNYRASINGTPTIGSAAVTLHVSIFALMVCLLVVSVTAIDTIHHQARTFADVAVSDDARTD